ncbi:XRE family transcriptional regulator [Mucilaginibacter limnophilus]|uniref:XRE family transcriptional regulator n=1 Tax=Mucilaginibacter limnophilus TaxID=1932778 RepID=A0A3S3TJG1_9SPHI|nr:helix-turn-helix transcriptional regulator [Mucilaginibacter limnophilus]RVU02454.1 XRE family transcriptional regulator [Mucilaginibacter limnophilus]
MEKHHGKIIEYRIRKNGYSISDLARCTQVNRRSVYNWFTQKNLKASIIYRVGCVLRHDFSEEFPELFTHDDFKQIYQVRQPFTQRANEPLFDETERWKNKYLNLLEKYNDTLLHVM